MIWCRLTMPERSFVVNASELVGIASHDANLAGDTVTSLFVNYQWRRIIAEGLQLYLDRAIYALDDPDFEDVHNKFQALLNDLYTPSSGTVTKFAVKVRRTANLVLFAGVSTPITWSSEDYDYGGFWDVGTPTQLVVPSGASGLYSIMVNMTIGLSAATARHILIKKNGNIEAKMVHSAETYFGYVTTAQLELTVGDIVTIEAQSNVAATLFYEPNNSPWVAMVRIVE